MEFKLYQKVSRTGKVIAVLIVAAMIVGAIIGALREGWNWGEITLTLLLILPAFLGLIVWSYTDDEEVEREYIRKVLIPAAVYVCFLVVVLPQLRTSLEQIEINLSARVGVFIGFLLGPQPWIEFFRIFYADIIFRLERRAQQAAQKTPSNIKGDQA